MSEIYLEILDDPVATTSVVTTDSSTTIEIEIQQDATAYSLPVQEFIEISEQGPTGDPAEAEALLFVKHNGTSYAARSTVTADSTRVVVWIGPVAPAINATYALNNVDVWWNTTA